MYRTNVSPKKNKQYTIKDGKNISVKYAINFGYKPMRRKRRIAPKRAVVA